MKKQNLSKRSFLTNFAMQTIFIIFLFVSNILPQVVIKERIEINPGVKMDYQMTLDSIYFNGCWYDFYDSSEIYIRFTPESVEPGGTTLIKLWIVDGVYEYNEDLYNFLQKTITIEPECGELNYIGGGEYLFTAPDTLTVDSIVVNIDYENYTHSCTNKAGIKEKTRIKDRYDCLSCMPLRRTLHRTYASEQLTIAWDSLDVQVEPDTIYPGGTVQVVIKKRLPDGTLTDFPPEQTYEIAKLEGCLSGNIVVGQDSGAYFYDVSQPIYFAVADSLVGDSLGTVLLQVGLVVNSEKPALENKPNNIESIECFTGNFQSESKDNTNLIINDVVRIDWTAGTYPINSVPEMPNSLSIWVWPNFFSGQPYFLDWDLEVKWISTEQEPDKTFSYTFNDQTMGTLANGIELLLLETDETIIGGDELTLTVRYTDNNFNNEEVTKKLTGMKILGTNGENNIQIVKDYINVHEFPQPIDLPLSEPVTLQDQRKQMQVIVEKESNYFQFKDERDEFHNYPADEWGYNNMNPNPHDWGLCQLSIAEPSLGIIWNWKENINAGIHFLWGTDSQIHKYAQVKNKFKELKKNYTEDGKEPRDPNKEEFLIMLAQRYKRGFYYTSYKHGNSKGEKGHYVKTTKEGWFEYGDDFCSRFGGLNCDN